MDSEIEKLVRENNNMLHKIRRSQKISSFLRILYWALIIGLGIGAYYFVQPWVESTLEVFRNTSENINNIKDSFPF